MQEASCLGCHCLPKVASSEVSFFFLTFGDAARQATPTLPPHALARAAALSAGSPLVLVIWRTFFCWLLWFLLLTSLCFPFDTFSSLSSSAKQVLVSFQRVYIIILVVIKLRIQPLFKLVFCKLTTKHVRNKPQPSGSAGWSIVPCTERSRDRFPVGASA